MYLNIYVQYGKAPASKKNLYSIAFFDDENGRMTVYI